MAKVTIEIDRGKLRLRWQYQGKRYALSLSLDDNKVGRGVAQMKAGQIQADMAAGHFDPTLLRYKPRTLGKNGTEISAPELFKRFSDYKLKHGGVEESSIKARYKPIKTYLEKYLNVPAEKVGEQQAKNFRSLLVERLSGQTAKERLWLLESCWEWARGKYHIAEENPWVGLASSIKMTPRQKVKPFTAAEVKAILTGFQSAPFYRKYYPVISFMFGVGCRFREAAALKWKHLDADFRTVWIGEAISRGGKRGSTKTRKVYDS